MFRALLPAILTITLTACSEEPQPEQAQRISMEAARQHIPAPLPSPDTSGAIWRVAADGQAIGFGAADGAPLLSLACDLGEDPPRMRIIRHVTARPGEQALFPVIGNGRISRFPVDANLADGEWRWEGIFPASDEQLDVFAGQREIEATLPGGGSLLIAGSSIPGEFVDWCRAGGKLAEAAATEQAADAPGAEASAAPPVR